MSNHQFPVPPLVPGSNGPGVPGESNPLVPGVNGDDLQPGLIEEGDEVALDPDADGDLVDSAEADRLAAGADDDAER